MSTKNNRYFIAGIFLFICSIPLTFLIEPIRNVIKWNSSTTWKCIEATIEAVELKSPWYKNLSSSDGPSYLHLEIYLTYTYTVENKVFTNRSKIKEHSFRTDIVSKSDISDYNKAVKEYSKGDTITVYYNPDKHNMSLAFSGKDAYNDLKISLTFVFIFNGLMLILFLFLFFRKDSSIT